MKRSQADADADAVSEEVSPSPSLKRSMTTAEESLSQDEDRKLSFDDYWGITGADYTNELIRRCLPEIRKAYLYVKKNSGSTVVDGLLNDNCGMSKLFHLAHSVIRMKDFLEHIGAARMTPSHLFGDDDAYHLPYSTTPTEARFRKPIRRNYYHEIYGELVGESYTKMVTNVLVSLYNKYAPQKKSGVLTTQTSSASFVGDQVSSSIDITSSKSKRMEIWYRREGISSTDSKSELDNYLEEPLLRVEGLNVLDWWKLNSPKYPTLSRIAHDILAIPVSSVPSESAFSTGGRVLNDHRASLSPKKVEALICTQSWLPPLSDSSTSWSTNEPTEANSDENDDQGDYNNTRNAVQGNDSDGRRLPCLLFICFL